MKTLKAITYLGCLLSLFLSGCGGGGGGGGEVVTTKTATLTLSYLKSNVSDQIGGFDLVIILPAGATVKVDNSGVPLASSVFMPVEFNGIFDVTYSAANATQNKLQVAAGNLTNQTGLQGVFLTVICTVPISYVPNPNDVTIGPVSPQTTIFTDQAGGGSIAVAASATFN